MFRHRFGEFTNKAETSIFPELNEPRQSPNVSQIIGPPLEESQLGYMFRRRRCRTPHETADRPSTRRRPVTGDTAAAAGAARAPPRDRPSTPDCLLNTAEAESVDTTEERRAEAEPDY